MKGVFQNFWKAKSNFFKTDSWGCHGPPSLYVAPSLTAVRCISYVPALFFFNLFRSAFYN